MNPIPYKIIMPKIRWLAVCGSSRKSRRKLCRKIFLMFNGLFKENEDECVALDNQTN